MKKYKIAQIIILIGIVYFLLMAYLFTLIKSVHIDFETTISNGVFESKINWITPIPKIKKISFPLAKIEQVTLREDKTTNNITSYSLEFKYFNKFNSSIPATSNISLMSKEYEYAQKIKEEISEALQNQKEFSCELLSLNIPEIRKAILMMYICAVTLFIVFIIVFVIEKKEKKKRKAYNSVENNINDSIIK